MFLDDPGVQRLMGNADQLCRLARRVDFRGHWKKLTSLLDTSSSSMLKSLADAYLGAFMISDARAALLGALIGGVFGMLGVWVGFYLSRRGSEEDRRTEKLFTLYN